MKEHPLNNGITRAKLWVPVIAVLAGTVLAILGETLFHDASLIGAGAGIAFVGAAVYALFRRLGAREARAGGFGQRGSPEDANGTSNL